MHWSKQTAPGRGRSGLKWHSTKKQRQHDYQRERFLILNDWVVVRFTGSEIYNHSAKSVRELITIIKHYEGKVIY